MSRSRDHFTRTAGSGLTPSAQAVIALVAIATLATLASGSASFPARVTGAAHPSVEAQAERVRAVAAAVAAAARELAGSDQYQVAFAPVSPLLAETADIRAALPQHIDDPACQTSVLHSHLIDLPPPTC